MSARATRWARRGIAVTAIAGAASVCLGPVAASAHPLGNFSINHSHHLTLAPDTITDRAVVDVAEIPTAQAKADIDLDGDGTISTAEADEHGRGECAALQRDLQLTVDGTAAPTRLVATSFALVEGQAGLPTGRLECTFEATVDLAAPRTVELRDGYEPDRVGWHEMSAVGDGVQLVDPPIPAESTTDELRSYPSDPLSSPLDQRDVRLDVRPGTFVPSAPQAAPSSKRSTLFDGGPLAPIVDRVSGKFDDLVGRRDLTLGVGLLAVALAMILGASHALLPGHGKTVMAAYIAGRQGSTRDAVMVGATVTITHTGGVLALGLALTLSSSLAGESVLGWLGLASGLLIAGLGTSLLINARRPGAAHGHRHRYDLHDHPHGDHHHHHDHDHDGHDLPGHDHDGHDHDGHDDDSHDDGHDHGRRVHLRRRGRRLAAHDGAQGAPRRVAVARHPRAGETVAAAPALPSGRSGDRGNVGVGSSDRGGAGTSVALADRRPASSTSIARARPPREAPSVASTGVRHVSRRGLVGMGIAGGLVPSPSALVVLLSAIALGRTAFGVLLVIGYGLGMAATLTLAGLLLIRVRDRLGPRMSAARTRGSTLARRWTAVAPYLTASLVVIVGLGIALRGLIAV